MPVLSSKPSHLHHRHHPPSNHLLEPVVVTLHSLNNDTFEQRRIVLSPSSPSIHVGRSSRNHNKNLQPAKDNAYIDSPVISREHALISLNTKGDTPALIIQDRGSMHGTLVNGTMLTNNKEQELRNGDV